MKTTTNYHLNQWDPGDRLLRTDFNGDNGKIDAAIHAAENRISSFSNQLSNTVSNVNGQISSAISTVDRKITALENRTGTRLLRDVTTTATAAAVDFYLNDINWSAWSVIYISLYPVTNGEYGPTVSVNGSYSLSTANCNCSGKNNFTLYSFYPMYESRSIVSCISFAPTRSEVISFSTDYAGFSTLHLQCGNGVQLTSGTNMKLWGVN